MKEFLVLGDSHAGVFKNVKAKFNKAGSIEEIIFRPKIVPGVTAQGLVNPNAKTHSIDIFKDILKQYANQASKCLMMLGEVDCGFVIWYRVDKYNDSLDNQVNRSINNYFEFIDTEVRRYFQPKDILICGVSPPVIMDNSDKNFLMGARSEVTASLEQRTILTKEYNNMLCSYSKERQYNYISIFDKVISSDTGLVSQEYLRENPSDHHLSTEKTLPLWLYEIGIITI